MRIQCENCNATYTIDDGQLSDQPIGAQCPYCGHVKLVRRSDATEVASKLGFGGPPPPGAPAAPANPGADLGFGSEAPTTGGAPSASPFASSPFGGGGLETPPADSSFGTMPPAGAAPAGDDAGCQVCGTPLVDEFDKVIGLCDEHQRERRGPEAGGAGGPGADPGGGVQTGSWVAKALDGRTFGPMSLDELRTQIRAGQIPMTSDFSPDGSSFGPIARYKELAYLASLAQSDGAAAPKPSFAGKPSFSPGRFLTPLLLVALVGGLGYLGYAQRDKLQRLYAGVVDGNTRTPTAGPNPLKRFLSQWRLRHPDVSGTAREHLVTARARHIEDTWSGYQAAQNSFERALILEPDDPEAVAGYVENLAIWRFATASPDELKAARAAVRYAKAIAPEHPAPFRAEAALALANEDLNGCRAGADGALTRDPRDARAKLLIAGCFIEGNVPLSIQQAERAKQMESGLRRADRVLATANARGGAYASAFRILAARLEVDPSNGLVHEQVGRVARAVGDYQKAESHFRRASELEGDKQSALLALADLYLGQNEYSKASSVYERAARERASHGHRAARIYTGWAQAELGRRQADRAARLADQAMRFEQGHLPALLARGEAALLAGSATTAMAFGRKVLSIRDEKEPAARALVARAAALEQNAAAAVAELEAAAKNDPLNPRIKGLLAAQYLSMNADSQAYSVMVKTLEIDPQEADDAPSEGSLPIPDAAVLSAIDKFRRSASKPRNRAVARGAMATLYYFLGDRSKAADSTERALRADSRNPGALLYAAQIALNGSNLSVARKHVNKLLTVDRGNALAFLLDGRISAAEGKPDKARDALQSALRSNPGLMAAKVELAALDLEAGRRAEAIKALQKAFDIDPTSMRVRRLLLQADL